MPYCPPLQLVKIHSPMRADFTRVVNSLPSESILNAARTASEKVLRYLKIMQLTSVKQPKPFLTTGLIT